MVVKSYKRSGSKLARRSVNPKLLKKTLAQADVHHFNAEESENKGDLAGAAKNYRRSFDLRYSMLGHNDPTVMGTAHKLANLMTKQEKYKEAESYLNWCLKAKAKKHTPGAFEFAETQNALGNLYLKQEKYDKAINKYKQVVALHERYKGPTSKATFKARKALAKAYLKSGDRDKYEELMNNALVAFKPASKEATSAGPTAQAP